MADPIAALKALVDISKLKSGEDAAADYLSKVSERKSTAGLMDHGPVRSRPWVCFWYASFPYFKMFVAVLDNDPKIALLKASGVGSLVPGPLLEESKKICRDLYTGFMVR